MLKSVVEITILDGKVIDLKEGVENLKSICLEQIDFKLGME